MENINLNEKESKAQSAQILKALKNGEKLTHLDAERRFNCLRLGARIYDLKQKGYPIETEMITVPGGKRVAQYSMVV
ncbi:TPA: helix-turn-helix domain-containing protein [Pasteurella multocida]|nr:helix-turn-helix domain-containing protein [Pasteurella multocida]HDR1190938.1 helix-turn-helix domain-containing protein [Pasteurella multocida]HDR1193167.1 helix-turn-helix domain-containing protein [Pasteurella multocida]HDR1201865.1 helix-turn-helix domain-containing protein [Pasteurella multocida]HDR1212571.1 helix-turn-helix domain-containing protein [Pasteurella multocida]